jgi:hypothetical protein
LRLQKSLFDVPSIISIYKKLIAENAKTYVRVKFGASLQIL